MIKILEDLLIEATTNLNVPGSLVAGLRKAVDDARCGSVKGKTFAFSGVLPTPFDSQEEAKRAAGVPVPHTTEPVPSVYHVCIKTTPHGHQVGAVVQGLQAPYLGEYWAPCDKDGWISAAAGFIPAGLKVEFRGSRDEGANPTDWRPARAPQVSAIDEMAEQMKRWATPTREPVAWFDKDGKIQGSVSDEQLYMLCENAQIALEERNAWDEQYKAQEDAHFKSVKPSNPKDAAATDRVPLGLLSPIAKAHWALAQHCGRAKYGAWNWREAGVRASIYIDAIGRHTDGYLSGETYDPADGTHHLGNIMACCAILLEAEAAGKLTDDRPPTLDMRPTYADVQGRLADLTTKYADRNPKHWAR